MKTNRLFADISNYTERFDAHAYAKGGHFLVMILAADGQTFVSPKYAEQAEAAHLRGLAVWHYLYDRPADSPGGLASHFWATVKPHYRPHDRLVLDLEERHPAGRKALIDHTHQLDRALQHISGVHAVAYTYDSLLREIGLHWQIDSGDWHIANYGGHVWPLGWGRRMIAQQYTNGADGEDPHRYAGIGNCDGNRLAWWYYRKLQRETRKLNRTGA